MNKAEIIRRCATPDAESVAAKLHNYAAQVITTPDEYAATLQLSLQHHNRHFRCLQENSGGIEAHLYTGRVSKRSNHLLKDYVFQSAFHIGLGGPRPLLQDYKRREATGQHAGFGIGRRFLRMAMCLMCSSRVYLPQKLRNPKTQMQERAGYYLTIWPLLLDKWKKAHAHQAAFAKDQPFGQWPQMVQELYDIKLKL